MTLLELVLFSAAISGILLLVFRGDEEWYVPVAGAALTLLAPLIVSFVFSHFVFAKSPVYVYGAMDVSADLKAAGAVAESTAEAGLALAKAAAYGVLGAAAAEDALKALAAVAAVFGQIEVAANALTVLETIVEPLHLALLTIYNVAVGVGMAFHVLAIAAEAAEALVPALLPISLALLVLPRARAVGGLLLGVSLILYAAAMAALYFSGPVGDILKWGYEVVQWANKTMEVVERAKEAANFSSLIVPYGGGLFYGRYNAALSVSAVQAKLDEVLLAAQIPGGPRPGDVKVVVRNGSDYVAANGPTPIWNGNATWYNYTTVFAWLDVPRSPEKAPWDLSHYVELYETLTPQYSEKGREIVQAAASFYNDVNPLWRVYTGPQPWWDLLTAAVRVESSVLNYTERGSVPAVVGVWGWLKPPPSYNLTRDVTASPGYLSFNATSGAYWVRPETKDAVLSFVMPGDTGSLKQVNSIYFYKWTELCQWCINGTCKSTSREAREEPVVKERLVERQEPLPITLYSRPWVPEGPRDVVLNFTYTYRMWEVSKDVEYGPWSDGPPPPNATCRIEDVQPYKRVVVWSRDGVVDYVYGFAWLSSVSQVRARGNATLGEWGNGSDINIVEGPAYAYECKSFVVEASEPRWRWVPEAVDNLTRLNSEFAYAYYTTGQFVEYKYDVAERIIDANRQYVDPKIARLVEGLMEMPGQPMVYPLPEAEPVGYRPYNVVVACVYGARAAPRINMTLAPGASAWLMSYPMGDSALSEEAAHAAASLWRFLEANPPPPPPRSVEELAGEIAFAIPAAPIAPIRYAYEAMAAWLNVYGNIFAGLVMAVAALEALAAVLDFPSPGVLLASFIWDVIQDLAFWYQIRMLVKARIFSKVFRLHPVRALARRAVHKLYYKASLKTRLERPDAERRALERLERWPEHKLRRTVEGWAERAVSRTAEAARRAAGKAKEAAERAWEKVEPAAERALRRAKPIAEKAGRAFKCHDVICALRQIDVVDRWFEERIERAGPLSYLFFWSWFDDKMTRLLKAAAKRHAPVEQRQALENLRLFDQALRRAEKAKALRTSAPAEIIERAEEVERRALEASLSAIDRLKEAVMAGAPQEEVERLIAEVVDPLARYHQSARAKFERIVKEVFGPNGLSNAPEAFEELKQRWAEEWSHAFSLKAEQDWRKLQRLEKRAGAIYALDLALSVARGARLDEAKKAVETKQGDPRALEKYADLAYLVKDVEIPAKYAKLLERAIEARERGDAKALAEIERRAERELGKIIREIDRDFALGYAKSAAERALAKALAGEDRRAAAEEMRRELERVGFGDLAKRAARVLEGVEPVRAQIDAAEASAKADAAKRALEALDERSLRVATDLERVKTAKEAYRAALEYDKALSKAIEAYGRLREAAEAYDGSISAASRLAESHRQYAEAVAKLRELEEVLSKAPVDLGLARSRADVAEDAKLYVDARRFKQLVERLRAADESERPRILAELKALAAELQRRPREEVAKAFREPVFGKAERLAAFVEAYKLAGELARTREPAVQFVELVKKAEAAPPEEKKRIAKRLADVAATLKIMPKEEVAKAIKEAERAVEIEERLRVLAGQLGVNAEELRLWASAAAEDLRRAEALREALEDLGVPPAIVAMFGAEKAKALLRQTARENEALAQLAEFYATGRLDYDFALLEKAAKKRGLPTEPLRAAAELRRLFEKEDREAWWRWAVLNAPPAAHLLTSMPLSQARAAARYLEGMEVVEDISLFAPARLGLPVPVVDPLFSHLAHLETYPEKAAKYIADWSNEGVRRGVRRFFKANVEHLKAAEVVLHAAKAAAYLHIAAKLRRKAASSPEAKAAEIAARLLAAKAALHELRIAQIKGDGALAEEAARRFRAALRAARKAAEELPREELVEGLREYFGNRAKLARGGLEKLVHALDLRPLWRAFRDEWIAGALNAERTYYRLVKPLREEGRAAAEPKTAAGLKALEAPISWRPDLVHEAVLSALRDWLEIRVDELREALRRSRPETAPSTLRGLARGDGDFREHARKFVEDVKSIAQFSHAAKFALIQAAEELAKWRIEAELAKYAAMRIIQAAKTEVEGKYDALPEGLKHVSSMYIREYEHLYYPDKLKKIAEALHLKELWGRAKLEDLAVGLESVGAKKAAEAVKQLAEADLEVAVERAEDAGRIMAEELAEAVKTARAAKEEEKKELLRVLGSNDADAILAKVYDVLARIKDFAPIKDELAGEIIAKATEGRILIAKNERTAAALSRHYDVKRVEAVYLEEGEMRREGLYLLVPPAREGELRAALDFAEAELAKRGYFLANFGGDVPPYAVFLLQPKERIAVVEENGALHAYFLERAEDLARGVAEALADNDVERARRIYKALDRIRRLIAIRHGLREESAVEELIKKKLAEALRERIKEDRRAVYDWSPMPELSKAFGADVFDVKEWLEWFEERRGLPPAVPEAFVPAARFYSEATGKPYRDVLRSIFSWEGATAAYIKETVEIARRELGEERPYAREEAYRREEASPYARARLREEARPLSERGARLVEREEERRKAEKEARVEAAEKEVAKRAEERRPEAERAKKKAEGVLRGEVYGVEAALELARAFGASSEDIEKALGKALEKARAKAAEAVRRIALRRKMELFRALEDFLNDVDQEVRSIVSTLASSPEAVKYAELLAYRLEDAYAGYLEDGVARDAYKLFKRVIDAAKKAEEELGAGDVVLKYAEVLADNLLREAEKAWGRAFKALSMAERLLLPMAASAAGAVAAVVVHDAVMGASAAMASAVALTLAERYQEAVAKIREAAEAIYERLKQLGVALERAVEAVAEAVARAVGYIKAHWLLMAAAAAGLITWTTAQWLDHTLWMDHIAFAAFAIAPASFIEVVEKKLEYVKSHEFNLLYESAIRVLEEDKLFRRSIEKKLGRRLIVDEKKVLGQVIAASSLTILAPYVFAKHRPPLELGVSKLRNLQPSQSIEVPVDFQKWVQWVREWKELKKQIEDVISHLRGYFKRSPGVGEDFCTFLEGQFELRHVRDLSTFGSNEMRLFDSTFADRIYAFVESLLDDATWAITVRSILEEAVVESGEQIKIKEPELVCRIFTKESTSKLVEEYYKEPYKTLEEKVNYMAERAVVAFAKLAAEGKLKINELSLRIEKWRSDKWLIIVKTDKLTVQFEQKDTIWRARDKELAEILAEPLSTDLKLGEGFLRALLVTDGSYDSNVGIIARTTSEVQALLYTALDLGVSPDEKIDLTQHGLKVEYKGQRYASVDMWREMLQGVEIGEVIRWLGEAKDVRLTGYADPQKLAEAIEDLKNLEIGDGYLIINGVKITHEDGPFIRIFAPLLYYLGAERDVQDVAEFFIGATLFDGSVSANEAYLGVGRFKADEVKRRDLVEKFNVYHKAALWVAFAKKYGIGIRSIYRDKEGTLRINFDIADVLQKFLLVRDVLIKLADSRPLKRADHLQKKIYKLDLTVRGYTQISVKPVERDNLEITLTYIGNKKKRTKEPKRLVELIATVKREGGQPRVEFTSEEAARMAAAALSSLGWEAIQAGGELVVEELRRVAEKYIENLKTAIREVDSTQKEKLTRYATESGQDRAQEVLRQEGRMAKEQNQRNAAKTRPTVASIKTSHTPTTPSVDEMKKLLSYLTYITVSPDVAEALRRVGLEEVVYLRKADDGQSYIVEEEGLLKLALRTVFDQDREAGEALMKLKSDPSHSEIVDAYINFAQQVESVTLSELSDEDIKILNISAKREDGELLVDIQYEVDGRPDKLTLTWEVQRDDGKVRARVGVGDPSRAEVMAKVFVIDKSKIDKVKETRDKRLLLSRDDLFALARIKGVGLEVMKWYVDDVARIRANRRQHH